MGNSKSLFILFASLNSRQYYKIHYKILTGFELLTSGVGSDCSANWANTAAQ